MYELGFLTGLGKPVLGYTNVSTSMLARIDPVSREPNGVRIDKNGWTVEDFGNADNLMIDCSLATQGGRAGSLRCGGQDR